MDYIRLSGCLDVDTPFSAIVPYLELLLDPGPTIKSFFSPFPSSCNGVKDDRLPILIPLESKHHAHN